MRPLASFVLIILAVLPARGQVQPQTQAQPTTRIAYIQVPEAEVRAKGSLHAEIYPTNRLAYGTKIEVVEEKDGWVAITPPPLSKSWIEFSKVNADSGNRNHFTVTASTKVPTLIGPFDPTKRPTIEGVSVGRGTIVTALPIPNNPTKQDGKEWLAIEPPEGELRWVQRSAVGGLPSAPSPPPIAPGITANGNAQGNSSQPIGVGPLPTPVIPPAAKPIELLNPQERWNQAVEAERAGRAADALSIYTAMAQDYATSAPDWARSASLQAERLRNSAAVQGYPAAQQQPYMQQQPARYYPTNCTPLPSYLYTPGVPLVPYAAGTTFPPPQQPQMGPPATMPTANPQPAPAPGATGKTVGAGLPRGRGYLRKSGRFVDRRPLYMLETIEGRPIYYMMPVQGVSLEPYMNHLVDVSGGTFYNAENRAEIMYVQQISLAPQ